MIPSTVQLLLAIVLVLLGLCGNLAIPFISYRTTLRRPHITMLAVLDFTATLLGPGVMLLIIVIGPSWLEPNKFLCHSLSFLSSWMLITCFLVLFSLAVFCQKVQDNVHPGEIRRVKRREFAFLAVCLSTGLLLVVLPFLGWSSYHGLPFLHSCSLKRRFYSISNYSLFYLVSSFVVLSVTIVLVFRARKHRRLYPLQIFWERHEYEKKMNDPELTTTASSDTSYHSRRSRRSIASRIQSRIHFRHQSRQSSVRSRSGTILSFNITESPIMSRKSPSEQFGQLDCNLLEIILQNSPKAGCDTGEGVVDGESLSPPSKSDRKDSQSSSAPSFERSISTNSSRSTKTFRSSPFVISSKIPQNIHAILHTRKHFKSPRFLRQFKALQRQLSLLRLLSLRCCVTLLCWLPLYFTVALQLFLVHYPQELHVFIQWLIVVHSSISPLLPLCDTTYRQALKRAAHSIFKTYARGNKTSVDLSKSRDVELEIEGIQQVRLSSMVLNKL